MPSPLTILPHHTEPVDPTLVDWLLNKIHDVLGLEPGVMVILLGALIVLFPLGLLSFMWYQRRKAVKRAGS